MSHYTITFFSALSRSAAGGFARLISGGTILALLAQTTPVLALHQQGREIVLTEGTEFMVETTDELSSKTANADDPITFRITDDVRLNGHILIARGTLAKGVIMNLEKSRRFGRGGKLGIKIDSTTAVDGQKIKLRASKNREGDDKTGKVLALTLLISPLFLLMKGKEAVIKEGTKLAVYVDEAKSVQVKD